MSYSIIGKFKCGDEVVYTAILDELKCLNERAYDVSLYGINPSDEGFWYDMNSFVEGAKVYEKGHGKASHWLKALENLVGTSDFYDKNFDRESYESDLAQAREAKKHHKAGYEICLKMIGMFELLSQVVTEDDCEERKIILTLEAE